MGGMWQKQINFFGVTTSLASSRPIAYHARRQIEVVKYAWQSLYGVQAFGTSYGFFLCVYHSLTVFLMGRPSAGDR